MSAGLISAMAEPLVALVHSLGSGALPQNFGAALRSSATAIDAAHEQHRAGIGVLEAAWRGPAAQSAQQTAAAVQTAAASISDRGEELATVVDRAAADVAAGVRKLEDILRAFLDKADRLVPFLLTPMGLIGLVGLAQEHLQQALVVVGEIRAKLDAHTAAVTKLMPPPNQVPGPVTAPLDTAAVSSVVAAGANPAVTAVDLLKTTGSTVQEAAASFNAASFSPKAARGGAGTPGYDGAQPAPGTPDAAGGVPVRLPDGSVVNAPNERAAAAVRAALGQQGVPYVWGGTTPGRGLDCSGLTQYAYREAGVELPRIAQEQGAGHQRIGSNDVLPGDLAVWDGHVAMVIGNGKMIEAGNPVEISRIRMENQGMQFQGFYRPTA